MALANHRTGYLNGTTAGWNAQSLFYLNGAWYLVALDTSSVKIRVYKAADGLTWVEQDSANALTHTGSTDSYGAGAPLSGTSAGKLHVVYFTSLYTIRCRIFDTSTDTWAGSDVGGVNVVSDVQPLGSTGVAVRSDGDILIFYRSISGGIARYARWEGSSWTIANFDSNDDIAISAVMTGNSDMCHVFFFDALFGARINKQKSLDSSNTQGTVSTIDSSSNTVVQRGGFGGYVNDSGTHRIAHLVWDSGGELDFAHSTSSSNPSWTIVGSVSPTSTTDPGSMGGVVVPFDRGWHAIWSGDGRGEIHKDFSDDYASPAFTTDTNVITGLGNDPAVYAAAGPTGILAAYTDHTTPSVDSIWAVGAPASSHYVGNIGTDTYNSTNTNTRTITLTGDADVGQTIVLYSLCNGSRTLTSVADSQSNTWSSTIEVNNGSNFGVQLTHVHITNAMTAGDTITLTWSGSGATRISRAELFEGLETSSSWDVSNTATASAGSISAATGTLAQAEELIFTIAGTTADTGHVFLANQVKLGEQVTAVGSNDRFMAASYQEVNATTSVTSGILFSASRTAALATATLKIATGGSSVNIAAALATATGGGYTPSFTYSSSVAAALATSTAGGYTPSLRETILAELATATAGGYTPAVTLSAAVAAALATATGGAYTPSLRVSIEAQLAEATADAYGPSVSTPSPAVDIAAALATATAGGYVPSFQAASNIAAALATATAGTYTPSLRVSILAGTATATAGTYVIVFSAENTIYATMIVTRPYQAILLTKVALDGSLYSGDAWQAHIVSDDSLDGDVVSERPWDARLVTQ